MIKFEHQIVDEKIVYVIPKEICEQMIERAHKGLVNCFPVANEGFVAAVLAESGNIYEGVSYKSKTYTLTMHAEATALAHANIKGESRIIAATAGPDCNICHICKQLLWENSLQSGIDLVIIKKEGAQILQIPISKLMLLPWPNLKN
jgi:cytidine deaminase